MKKSFLYGKSIPLLFAFIFAFLFYYFSITQTPTTGEITSDEIVNIFENYSKFFGIGLAFLSTIIAYFLILIKKLIGIGKLKILNVVVVLLSYLPWLIFAVQLLYYENQYTNIAKAIIFYTGAPMFYSSIIVFSLSGVWLLFEIFNILRKKAFILPIIIFLPVFSLTSCIGDIQYILCGTVMDSDHCFQGSAVQESNPDRCKEIKGKDFEGMGSNPPKDKCYLLIAENTGNQDLCDEIEGGMMSYTKEECFKSVAEKFENPLACEKMSGSDKENCINSLRSKIDALKVIDVDNQLDTLKEELEKDPDDANLKKQYEELEKKRVAMINILSEEEKKTYERQNEPINKLIISDFAQGNLDSETKETLIKLNERLKEQGVPFDKQSYEKFRDYVKYVKDPKNNIENMDDKDLADDKWRDKLGNAFDKVKFWKSNKTDEEKKYDEQLRFYERMLNRSKAISQNLSKLEQEFNEDLNTVLGGVAEFGADKVKGLVIEEIFGKGVSRAHSVTTAVLGEALDNVKKEAKSQEFRGLVRSYNLGMKEELAKHGGDVDKAHEAVISKMTKNPYEYEDKNTFAKYGNILENPDCDGKNPHCIEKDVFWKAMKKSYKYQNQ